MGWPAGSASKALGFLDPPDANTHYEPACWKFPSLQAPTPVPKMTSQGDPHRALLFRGPQEGTHRWSRPPPTAPAPVLPCPPPRAGPPRAAYRPAGHACVPNLGVTQGSGGGLQRDWNAPAEAVPPSAMVSPTLGDKITSHQRPHSRALGVLGLSTQGETPGKPAAFVSLHWTPVVKLWTWEGYVTL